MTRILGFAAEEDRFVFVDTYGDVLTEINMREGIVEKKEVLRFDSHKVFSKGMGCDGTIVFAPWVMNKPEVLFYDTFTGQIEKAALRPNTLGYEHSLFNDAIRIAGKVFLIPFRYGALVEIDVASREIRYHEECVIRSLPEEYATSDVLMFRFAAVWNKTILVMPYLSLRRIVWYDTTSNETGYFDVQADCSGFFGVCIEKDMLYLLGRDKGNLYVCDMNTHNITNIVHLVEGDGELLMNLVDCGAYLLALQRFSDVSYRIYKDTLAVEEVHLSDKAPVYNVNILCAAVGRDKEVWMTLRDGEQDFIGVYHMEDGSVRWIPIPTMKSQLMYRQMQFGEMLHEGAESGLDLFINEIKIRKEKSK